jgi:predicted RNA-binding Zn-ribbon protein involved in translation (DUF1610 family)
MAKTVTCSNAKCRTVIPAEGKAVGDIVACPKCGTSNTVLAEFGAEFEIETIEAPKAKPIHHPARQVCTNCGAVLGVRAVTCPQCGGDVRTGRTIIRITREEKQRRGLGKLLFGPKASPPAMTGAAAKSPAAPKQGMPLVPLLIGAAILCVVVIIVVVLIVAR